MNKTMEATELVFEIKKYKQYWTLKRRVLRRLKMNKHHRKERIKQLVNRKMQNH
jgi:hypothetical protein